MIALTACISMRATDITLQMGENVINVTDWMVNATYKVQTTGKVVIDAATVFEVSCDGTTYEHQYASGAQHGAYHYEVDAEAGQVISMVCSFFMANGTSIWVSENGAGPVPISVQQVSPATNVKFGWQHAGQMSVNFNKPVTFDNIQLVAKGRKYGVEEATAWAGISCNLKSAIVRAIQEGSMKEGDPFVVRIEGLADQTDPTNKYGGDGVLELSYLAPALQGKLKSAQVNGTELVQNELNSYTMLSYYDAKGEDGVIRLEFDKKVMSAENVKIIMGNIDRSNEGLYYQGDVPFSIEENALVIDLRGELRSYARLFSGVDLEAMDVMLESAFTTLTLSVTNVVDMDGNPMESESQGAVGSYSFQMNYKEINDNIVMDGDREEDMEGSLKQIGDDVYVWIDQELKSIEGLHLYFKVIDEGQGQDEDGNPIYVDAMVSMGEEDIQTIESNDGEGVVLCFTIPELTWLLAEEEEAIAAAIGQPLRIVLQVKTKNGMPHDLIINYILDSPETGIRQAAQGRTQSPHAFWLSGQRAELAAGRKGILIKGGKKILCR